MGTDTIKQVIVVRKDLNMRKGKMAAQSCHASLKVFLDLGEITENGCISTANGKGGWVVCPDISLKIPLNDSMLQWLKGDFTKIVVGVDSLEELLEIYVQANEAKLPTSLIKDAAKTEFKEPTYTAVAIGPSYAEKVNKITGHLKLL